MKQFKVASVSDNTNDFGLYGMVLIALDGEAWQVGANSVNVKIKGAVLHVDVHGDSPAWENFGFEIPEKLERPPAKVVSEVWNQPVPV